MGENAQEVYCFVETVPDKCRLCYTCILKCPAKAIKIENRQATIIRERCIGCGNCVKNCSQGAKRIVNTVPEAETLLTGVRPVVACLAPSFPIEFCETMGFRSLVGSLRRLGFARVTEVAFGADLVADRYKTLAGSDDNRSWIATTCPAVVGYVERYAVELVGSLAPIASPMIAMSRALRRMYGPDIAVVFIGPCVSKKGEWKDPAVRGDIDAVITFPELRAMLEAKGINPADCEPSDFDPPHPRAGMIFPTSRGILQSAEIPEDMFTGAIVATDGTGNLVQSVGAFGRGELDVHLLEILSCHGCVMGPGITVGGSQFLRSARLRAYVRDRLASLDEGEWRATMDSLTDLDISRSFTANDQRREEPADADIRLILARMGKEKPEDELNCGACGYLTCWEHAVAIYKGLAQTEMCLPFVIDKLQTTITELSDTHARLANVQDALMQSERLASMGQLAAGIAHELNNPLGIVLMYSNIILEQIEDEAVAEDLKTIVKEADRCKRIVSGLLNFTRRNKVAAKPTSVTELVDGFFKVHKMPETVELTVEHEVPGIVAELDSDQIVQVLTNLVTNAVAAMHERGGLRVVTGGNEREAWFKVDDSGSGIPREHMKKLFSPFFTTKKAGQGTGLGLAVTYGIVKMHRGRIDVRSNPDPAAGPTGTTFTVTLPRVWSGADSAPAEDR